MGQHSRRGLWHQCRRLPLPARVCVAERLLFVCFCFYFGLHFADSWGKQHVDASAGQGNCARCRAFHAPMCRSLRPPAKAQGESTQVCNTSRMRGARSTRRTCLARLIVTVAVKFGITMEIVVVMPCAVSCEGFVSGLYVMSPVLLLSHSVSTPLPMFAVASDWACPRATPRRMSCACRELWCHAVCGVSCCVPSCPRRFSWHQTVCQVVPLLMPVVRCVTSCPASGINLRMRVSAG